MKRFVGGVEQFSMSMINGIKRQQSHTAEGKSGDEEREREVSCFVLKSSSELVN